MEYRLELELRQYRQAVVDGLSSSTRQQAKMLSRQDDGLTALIGGLNYVGSGLGGIESGLAGIGTGLDVIGADLARLVTSVDSALPSIVEHLAITAQEITDISHMMATPEETKAAERFRNGTTALVNAQKAGSPARIRQWYNHAVLDLREAVEAHKYHPKSWFNLGITLGRLGRYEEAAEAFASSAFFGVDQSLEFGATAVLLAAGLYRQAGLRDKSAEILQEYLGQLDRCAEIHLALAEHHGAPGELRRALELFPSLAADARQAGVECAEQVAADICSRDNSAVAYMKRLQQALDALDQGITAVGLRGIIMPSAVQLPTDGVEALLLASRFVPFALVDAKRLLVETNLALFGLNAATQNALPEVLPDSEQISDAKDEVERLRSRAAEIAGTISWLRVREKDDSLLDEVEIELSEAETTLREAETRNSSQLQAAHAKKAQVLRVTQLTRATIPGLLQALEAIIASAEAAEPRIIPFDLQGF